MLYLRNLTDPSANTVLMPTGWADPSRSLAAVFKLVLSGIGGFQVRRHVAHPCPRVIGSLPQSVTWYELTGMYFSPTMSVFDVPSVTPPTFSRGSKLSTLIPLCGLSYSPDVP